MDNADPGDGYAEAFDQHAPAILRYARRRLDSPDLAWDVVTDTFTAAWRHWDRRPGPDELLPWLYAIAGNALRDQRRSADRRHRLVVRLSAGRLASHAPDPADQVAVSHDLGAALARIPEADREVLRLVAWEGQTDARALGLILGLSPAGARSRVHRARRRLRAALADADTPVTGAPDRRRAEPAATPASARPASALPASALRSHAKEA